MEWQVSILQDPRFGDIPDPLSNKRVPAPKPISDSKQLFKSKRGSGFAATVAVVDEDEQPTENTKMQTFNQNKPAASRVVNPCPVFNADHAIVSCKVLLKKWNDSRQIAFASVA